MEHLLESASAPEQRPDGFADFVETNTPTLLRKAYLLTGSRHAAEELVQDTLVRLYPHWDRVRAAKVPLAYVQRSVTNNFFKQRRTGTARHEVAVNALPEKLDDVEPQAVLADRDEIQALLRRLSERQRTVLVLRFYGGLSDPEIAGEIGCRAGTVRSLASRGLASLREHLQTA